MDDCQKSVADNKLAVVWEAKTTSAGESSTFAAVSNCMIQAVFVEFRKAGSERVTIPAGQCQ